MRNYVKLVPYKERKRLLLLKTGYDLRLLCRVEHSVHKKRHEKDADKRDEIPGESEDRPKILDLEKNHRDAHRRPCADENEDVSQARSFTNHHLGDGKGNIERPCGACPKDYGEHSPLHAGVFAHMRRYPLPRNPYIEKPQKDEDRGQNAQNNENILSEKEERLFPKLGFPKGEGEHDEQRDERQAPAFQDLSSLHNATVSHTAYPTTNE